MAAHAAERGQRLVGNGHAREREDMTAAGAASVRTRRMDDRRTDPLTGERATSAR